MAQWNDNNRDRYSGRGNYNNSYGGSQSSSSNGYNSRGNDGPRKELPPEIIPQRVPEDYVDQAEKIMRSLMTNRETVTTSKIRGMLSLVTEIYNKENIRTDKKLLPESVIKLNLMRVRVAYEYGRDSGKKVKGRDDKIYPIRDFITQSQLLEYLKGVSDDRTDLIRFAHYMEALVAYHRYFGGKED